jgi:hypothetical protein
MKKVLRGGILLLENVLFVAGVSWRFDGKESLKAASAPVMSPMRWRGPYKLL